MTKATFVVVGMLGAVALAAGVVVACGTSSTEGSPDAGADTGSVADTSVGPADSGASPDTAAGPVDASDAGPTADAADAGPCGRTGMGTLVTLFPAGTSATGAKVSYDICSGALATTPAIPGYSAPWAVPVSQAPSVFRSTFPGFRTSLSAEIDPVVFSVSSTRVPLQLVSDSALTGFDASKAHIVIALSESDPCPRSGGTAAVPGHPEAVVRYPSAAGVDSGDTSTDASGLIWIYGITPGAPVKPTIAHAGGCVAKPTFTTGNVYLEANTVSVLNARLER